MITCLAFWIGKLGARSRRLRFAVVPDHRILFTLTGFLCDDLDLWPIEQMRRISVNLTSTPRFSESVGRATNEKAGSTDSAQYEHPLRFGIR